MKKIIFLFLAITYQFSNSFAQPTNNKNTEGGYYEAGSCTSGDCQNGQGTYKFNKGEVYVGHFQNGTFNGQGTLIYAHGLFKYTGEFTDGDFNGFGTDIHVFTIQRGNVVTMDTLVAIGWWEYDRFIGRGKNSVTRGSGYIEISKSRELLEDTGCISGDCQNGEGTYVYPNGNKYVGNFSNGRWNGYGTVTWTETKTNCINCNRAYVGNFKDGYFDGIGTLTMNGQSVYGKWQYGKYIGKPVDTGCVSGNCQSGQGTYNYGNGQKYIGEFKYGKRNGHGTLIFANGHKYIGEWKDNLLSGQVTVEWDGNKYVGEFKDGQFNGHGTLTKSDGSVLVGEWKNNQYVENIIQQNVSRTVPTKVYASDGQRCSNCGLGIYSGGFCTMCGAASPERANQSRESLPPCDVCNGTGFIHAMNGDLIVCPACHGSGKATF